MWYEKIWKISLWHCTCDGSITHAHYHSLFIPGWSSLSGLPTDWELHAQEWKTSSRWGTHAHVCLRFVLKSRSATLFLEKSYTVVIRLWHTCRGSYILPLILFSSPKSSDICLIAANIHFGSIYLRGGNIVAEKLLLSMSLHTHLHTYPLVYPEMIWRLFVAATLWGIPVNSLFIAILQ